MFILAPGLIFAWKISGFIGTDYYLLNRVGTPWGRDKVVEEGTPDMEKQYTG